LTNKIVGFGFKKIHFSSDLIGQTLLYSHPSQPSITSTVILHSHPPHTSEAIHHSHSVMHRSHPSARSSVTVIHHNHSSQPDTTIIHRSQTPQSFIAAIRHNPSIHRSHPIHRIIDHIIHPSITMR
jgi:hypothetical protein